jgi:hypothetical protein
MGELTKYAVAVLAVLAFAFGALLVAVPIEIVMYVLIGGIALLGADEAEARFGIPALVVAAFALEFITPILPDEILVDALIAYVAWKYE